MEKDDYVGGQLRTMKLSLVFRLKGRKNCRQRTLATTETPTEENFSTRVEMFGDKNPHESAEVVLSLWCYYWWH